MGESFQDYSWIQDFEDDFSQKVKLLNSGDYISFSDLFSVCLRTTNHLNLKLWICSGHTASFKIEISKVQDFGNFELSPMLLQNEIFLWLSPFHLFQRKWILIWRGCYQRWSQIYEIKTRCSSKIPRSSHFVRVDQYRHSHSRIYRLGCISGGWSSQIEK